MIKIEYKRDGSDVDYTKVIDAEIGEPIILYWEYEDPDTAAITIMSTIGFLAELNKKYVSIERSFPIGVVTQPGEDDFYSSGGIIGYKKLK